MTKSALNLFTYRNTLPSQRNTNRAGIEQNRKLTLDLDEIGRCKTMPELHGIEDTYKIATQIPDCIPMFANRSHRRDSATAPNS